MGATVAPKYFPSLGALQAPGNQNGVVAPAVQAPQNPLNPGLIPLTAYNLKAPTVAAPNSTPSPIPTGVDNNRKAIIKTQYSLPGGGRRLFGPYSLA
jgi:hypothetical protein